MSESAANMTMGSTLQKTAPTAPTQVNTMGYAAGDLLITWSQPINDGGSPVIDYEVSVNGVVACTVSAISLSAFLLGVFKGTFFGVVVALTGCLRGMQCGTNAAAVGQATTSAVVTGITTIVASDGLFAVICSALHI